MNSVAAIKMLIHRRLLVCTPHAPTSLKRKPKAKERMTCSTGGGDMRELFPLEVSFFTASARMRMQTTTSIMRSPKKSNFMEAVLPGGGPGSAHTTKDPVIVPD